jgi:hypothetical protein
VTNAKVTVYIALRWGEDRMAWATGADVFRNTLRQIVDPTKGGHMCDEPDEEGDLSNTAKGLLDWKGRLTASVIVPTVYSKVKWAKRRLSLEELGHAGDIPGDKVEGMGAGSLKVIVQGPVPGKLLASIAASLKRTARIKDEERVAKKRDGGILEREGSKRTRPEAANDWDSREEALWERVGSESAKKRIRDLSEESREGKRGRLEPAAEQPSPPEFVAEEDEEEAADMTTATAKAVKSDNARIPKHLWDERVFDPKVFGELKELKPEKKEGVLSSLRAGCHAFWKKKVERDFIEWFHQMEHRYDEREDIWLAGLKACVYARRSDWWDWIGGSRIFFWRWPGRYMKEAQEGVPPYFVGEPPDSMDAQPPYQDEETRKKVRVKVQSVLDKGYIVRCDPASLRSLMFMFDVPKGDDDVRMVYDGSKSGLNEALWAPWFALPTVDAMTRGLLPGYWCADNDYGEQFLNFNLHKDLQLYCGIDLSQLFPEQLKTATGLILARWSRNAMGLKPSPYACVKGALRAKRIILGDRRDPENPFHWERAEENLPGDDGYEADQPWIRKVRWDGHLGTELLQYIDDLRTTAHSKELAWRASSRIAKTCCWLGLQDAARKRREPSQRPGAWAGATVMMNETNAYKGVTPDRWRKTQAKVRWLGFQVGLVDDVTRDLMDLEELGKDRKDAPRGHMLHKTAESLRGFLVYVARTYKAMVPYLKGIHLSLDSWRANRDEDGWRITNTVEPKVETTGREKPPKWTRLVSRYKNDLMALMVLTSDKEPPHVPVRPTQVAAAFLVGDASGSGFGTSTWTQDEEEIVAQFGAWDIGTSNESSNFREAYNLVLRVEQMVERGELKEGAEVFIFTDNFVSERAFYNGSSKSKRLHELVMRLRKLEMQGRIFVRVIWFAGTRMKEQGVDGLSRGDLTGGVMVGDKFLSFLPLNETVLERAPAFREGFSKGLVGQGWKWLSTEEWFDVAFDDDSGKFVWCPPPALADVALEQMCEVKHVHPNTTHVFLCPALMTAYWRKQLLKAADCCVTLLQGAPLWVARQHEPVVCALICPLLKHRPWQVKQQAWVEEWKCQVPRLWREGGRHWRHHMRQFWLGKKD